MLSMEVMHSVVKRGGSLTSSLPGLISVEAITPFPFPGIGSTVQRPFPRVSLSAEVPFGWEVLLGAMVK